jgi:hypothetical protein
MPSSGSTYITCRSCSLSGMGNPKFEGMGLLNLRAKFVLSIGLLALLGLMLPGSVRADTYSYTSNDLNLCEGIDATYCNNAPYTETITFTTATPGPLAANLYDFVAVSSFSFTDTEGLDLTDANIVDSSNYDDYFILQTDTAGDITGWNIYAESSSAPGPVLAGYSYNLYGNNTDETENETLNSSNLPTAGGYSYNEGVTNGGDALPGTWIDETTATNTPEPSSFLLLGTGLLALVGLGWRRNSSASSSILS